MRRLLLYTCLSALLAAGCGPKKTTANHHNDNGGNDDDNKGEALLFIKHKTVDKEGTGLVASTSLIPEGWIMKENLTWERNDPTVPIRYEGTLQTPDKTMLVQSYADSRHVWYTGPSGTNGAKPPKDIIDGLKFLIRSERGEKDITFVSEKILADKPENSEQGGSQIRSTNQSGMVKIAYEEDGEPVDEEFYGVLQVSDIISPTALGNSESIPWSASSLYSIKAPKGHLKECRKIAQTFHNSIRTTKPFYNKLLQVIQLLTDQSYLQIFRAGQISKLISATNDQMIENIDASYRSSQQAYDRVNNEFSDYIRGVDRWSAGGSEVQLPSGYDNAWVNDRGQYLVSNTSGYDPGKEYEGTWTQLDRKE